MSEYALSVFDEAGVESVIYVPWPHQAKFHASAAPNLLALGTRGTGKSLQLRMDAILRCLMIPNFHALILRRTMPELRRSHLVDIPVEMKKLGGVFLLTVNVAKFPNGSSITFGHCETEADVLNYLSSQYGFVGFDELSTFELRQFLQICASARASVDAPYRAVVRASSNTLGVGSEWMRSWFVDKDVRMEDYPDYHPDDFEMIFSTLADNPSLDRVAYTARLQNLPEHIRRAWLLGEFVTEGTYFADFHASHIHDKESDPIPWHVIEEMPTLGGRYLLDYPWMSVYRAIDWGYWPDPAVCLWIAVLPNKRAIVFKERVWHRTLAADVAQQIRRESEGMRVVETFADPTMEIKTGTAYSIGELFEQNGVPLTYSINDRELFGYSVHNYLNTIIDGEPQVQIVKHACPQLIRTFPQLRMDPSNPSKIAEKGPDHYVIALAYFCMGCAAPSRNPSTGGSTPRWMRAK